MGYKKANTNDSTIKIEAVTRKNKGHVNSYEKIDRNLTINDFSVLKENISLENIVNIVEKPNGMYGSGILRPYYTLSDDSLIILDFSELFDEEYGYVYKNLIGATHLMIEADK